MLSRTERLARWIYLLLTLVPLLAAWLYSLAYSLGLRGVLSSGFTLEHWVRLLGLSGQAGEAWSTLFYSLWLSAASIGLIIALALPLSALLYFRPRTQGLGLWLYLPMTLPPVVAAFVFYELLSPSGLLSRLAFAAGLSQGIGSFPRLVNDPASLGIIITQVFLLFPFFSLVFAQQASQENMAALQRLSQSLGASKGRFFRSIYAPLILRRKMPLLLLYGVLLLGTYEIPLLLGQNSPRVLSVYIVEQLSRFDLQTIPLGHAMAALYTVLVLALLLYLLSRPSGKISES